jgi:hypothetical protein
MRRSSSFEDVLKELAEPNSLRIIERAVLANTVAKACNNPLARRRAYRAKTRALEHGIEKFPTQYSLISVEEGGRLLGIGFQHRRALHVRTCDLAPGTREWVAGERERIMRARVGSKTVATVEAA